MVGCLAGYWPLASITMPSAAYCFKLTAVLHTLFSS